MKQNFTKQLLCSAIALMLGIGTVDTVAAQEFVLRESAGATPAQLKEIKTYYDKAPLLEKFFILTSAETYCNSRYVSDDRSNVDEVEIILREINRIKEYKNKKGTDYPYQTDSINYQNGYIRICSRALTYWKYDDGKFLIATNLDHDGGCCDGRPTSEPKFFSFDGKEFVKTYGFRIYKGSNGSKVWWMDWFDFFTAEEYIVNCLTMDEVGEPYTMFYFLPSEGKDITVSVGSLGCGPSGISSSYEARYKWNGDGTFTKVGRSDDYIKQISEKIKRREEALKEQQIIESQIKPTAG